SFHQTAISGFRHLLRRLDQKARADRFFTETGTIGKLGRHRAGTQHGDSNSTRLEFTVQSLGKRQNIGFRCLVNRHPGPGRRKPATDPTFSGPPRWRARLSTKASDSSVNARTLRSITSWLSALAAPTRPNPALLTKNCGSTPCAVSASPITRAIPGLSKSAARTIGRDA